MLTVRAEDQVSTLSSCPFRMRASGSLVAAQIRTVQLLLTATIAWPSELKATLWDLAGVPSEDSNLLSACGIPQPTGLIDAAGYKSSGVRAEGNRHDHSTMSLEARISRVSTASQSAPLHPHRPSRDARLISG